MRWRGQEKDCPHQKDITKAQVTRCVTCHLWGRATEQNAPCHRGHGRVLPPRTASRMDTPPPRTFPKSCRPRAWLAASSSGAGPRRATAPRRGGGPRRPPAAAALGGGGGGPPRRAAVLRSPAPGGRRHDGERARGRERGGGRGGRLPLGGQEQRLHRLGCGRVWGVVGRSARSACGLPGDICEIACDTPAPFCFTLVGGLDNGYAFY